MDQHTEQAQSAAVGAASICQRCGQPCLTCDPPIVIEVPRHAGGRPVGSGVLPTPVLRQRVLVAAEEFWRKGETPTLRLVSFGIGGHPDSLSRMLVHRGLSWNAIRSDAYRRTYGRLMSGESA